MFKKHARDIITFKGEWYDEVKTLDKELESIKREIEGLRRFKNRLETYLNIDIECTPEKIEYKKVKKGKKIFIPPQFWNQI
jgi:hypothetical protein